MASFGVYLGFSMLLVTALALNISRLRIKLKVANGDADNKEMKKAIRAHMNSLEQIIPFTLLIFFLNSLLPSSYYLAVLSFLFLATRIVHAYSMLSSNFKLRTWTAGSTYLLQAVACFSVIIFSIL